MKPISSNLSFEQLNKKKAGLAPTAAPAKAAASPRNVPDKPPSQAPKTNLNDVKKFVQSDKKPELPKPDMKKPAEPKAIPKPIENKEKPIPQAAQEKPGRKAKDIEES